MTLLIDNYDSFSYNLYQIIGSFDPDILVVRNDEKTVDEIQALRPDRIILSPGPGRPENGGIMIELIQKLGSRIPILGICLGHQAICAAFGASITYAGKLMHGKQSEVLFETACPLFHGCPSKAPVARYHSLAADPDSLPGCLQITARTADGEIMGVRHKAFPIYGLQFHPESIITPDGAKMIRNFMNETIAKEAQP